MGVDRSQGLHRLQGLLQIPRKQRRCLLRRGGIIVIEEIIAHEPKPAPRFRLDPAVKDFYAFTRDSFTIENYQYSDFTGKIPVAL